MTDPTTEATTVDNTATEPTAEDYDTFAAAFGPADNSAVPAPDEVDAEPDDETPDNQPDADPGSENDTSGNREAAKYRRKLRAAETERDALQTRLEHVQRGEVERLVTEQLRDPADIWRDGAQVADLLDDNGNIDPAKVAKLAGAVLEAHAHWGIETTSPRQYGNPVSGASVPTRPQRDSFTAAFAPREH
ncbi:hypothetical protein ABFW14_28015 [Mycolicibacterium fortuitum]|uniref:hypothetical protein n=1 Tax=Mycolicibacterium fortuitum TaxID=1766 RepID=UPI0007EC31B4|nr:hypothetical protein [Mycolicibacterium fortuitum]OBK02759.1 hypothetical protein A5637_16205 [Mycolicibacterium fortuitum]